MSTALIDPALEAQRQAVLDQIAALGDLRPGSLVKRFKKCGYPNCKRAQPGARGHGPQWILTTSVDGKTRSRVIPADAVETTRAQIAECRRRRQLVADLIAVSDRICQARLQADPPDATTKPARRSSRPPPLPNSTGCSART